MTTEPTQQEIILLPELPPVPSRTEDEQATYNTKAFNFRAAERELQQKFNINVPLLNAALKSSTDLVPNMDAINTVAGAVGPITTVSEHVAEVSAVSGGMAAVNAVSDNMASIIAVSGQGTEIAVVAANMPAVLAAPDAATAAEGSATTAATKAEEAASNAASALASKNAAETSAITAITKAGEASTSAASAEAAKVAAEAARDEAQEIVGGNYALATRKISAGTGLSGGGDLTADRTLAVEFGTAAGTACQGNDSRLANARTPTAHAGTHKHGGADPLGVFFFGLITPYYGELDATGKHPLVNGVANTSWHICDGTDGTPDMRDRVPLGASTTREMGSTGGEETTSPTLSSTAVLVSGITGATTLTIAQMPRHGHTININHILNNDSRGVSGGPPSTNYKANTGDIGDSSSHTHPVSISTSNHTHTIPDGVSTVQPYIALHYLMYKGA